MLNWGLHGVIMVMLLGLERKVTNFLHARGYADSDGTEKKKTRWNLEPYLLSKYLLVNGGVQHK